MRYLTKNINKVFLFDFFTQEERNNPMFSSTQKLHEFFISSNILVACYYQNSKEEVLETLKSIANAEDLGDGVIIHFIGHGVYDERNVSAKIGFGNNIYIVLWTEIKNILCEINTHTNDGLIVNTTIMCYGNSIFNIADNESEKPFFAAVASLNETTLQTFEHNIHIYRTCLLNDSAKAMIDATNELLQQSEREKLYEVRVL